MNNKYFITKLVLNTLNEVRIKERSSSLLTFFLIIYVVNAYIRKVKSLKTIRLTLDYVPQILYAEKETSQVEEKCTDRDS